MKNRLQIFSTKTLAIITILTLLIYILINVLNTNIIYASQYREDYDETKIENYAGYKELITNLKEAHPTWNFTIFYTGLD